MLKFYKSGYDMTDLKILRDTLYEADRMIDQLAAFHGGSVDRVRSDIYNVLDYVERLVAGANTAVTPHS